MSRPRRRRATDALAFSLAVLLLAPACAPAAFQAVESGTGQDLRSVHVVSPTEVLIAGYAGTILRYDGENMVDTSTDAKRGPLLPNYYGIAKGETLEHIVGDSGIILRRIENNYAFEDSRTQRRLLTLLQATPIAAYAGGDGGLVLRNTGEMTWERVDVGAGGDAKITNGWSEGETQIIFATDRGTVIEGSGNTWTKDEVLTETSSAPLPLFAVWSSGTDGEVVATGLGGRIFRRTSKGSDWTLEESPVNQDLYGLFGTSRDRLFAVGARGTVLRYDGTKWNNQSAGTSKDLFAIHGDESGTHIYAVGSGGAVIRLVED